MYLFAKAEVPLSTSLYKTYLTRTELNADLEMIAFIYDIMCLTMIPQPGIRYLGCRDFKLSENTLYNNVWQNSAQGPIFNCQCLLLMIYYTIVTRGVILLLKYPFDNLVKIAAALLYTPGQDIALYIWWARSLVIWKLYG